MFRHKLRIGLFLILAASILLCAFSVWKARGDASQSNDLPPAGHAGWHKHSGHRMHQAHPGQKIPASHPMWRNGGNPSPDGKHFFGNFRGANLAIVFSAKRERLRLSSRRPFCGACWEPACA
ncbi:hypothetical protein [Thermoactinomyces sp. CICC 10521]|uniref:hypothetical protein n=1 Tax=Thermoactinomyces sp. CICC 10521 TaxID=2767426 RepID=UPI001E29125F|nr:hypothetical protein [Thermoactinomyces sp. CICC 10521]